VRYLAIAALAATFWLIVATVRVVLYPPGPLRPAKPDISSGDRCPWHASAGAGGDHPLSKVALVNGLLAVKPLVHACYEEYRVPGTAMADIVIAKSGRVSKAVVTGKFAGTPTGDCVEQAVMTATFPPSDGFLTPFPYQLR
jgi:hypothetical protein